MYLIGKSIKMLNIYAKETKWTIHFVTLRELSTLIILTTVVTCKDSNQPDKAMFVFSHGIHLSKLIFNEYQMSCKMYQ